MAAHLDGLSIVIGILIGMVIALVLIWIAYASRTFIFTFCATETTTCTSDDFVTDPETAVINGANPGDILFIKENRLLYKQVQTNPSCTPQTQFKTVEYPQFCRFQINDEEYEGKQIDAFSNIYAVGDQYITTTGHCMPEVNSIAVIGTPVAWWEVNNTKTRR
jgi:hypothetical protein